MSEKSTSYRRRVLAGLLIATGTMALAGCEDPNYEGAGNDFVIRGVVGRVKDNGTIKIDEKQIVVTEASGEASTWFTERKGQDIGSDDFNFYSGYKNPKKNHWYDSCGSFVIVGKVFDSDGTPIEPQQLNPGVVVEIQGDIRDSRYYQSTGKSGYCTENQRATFETVQVLDQPLR